MAERVTNRAHVRKVVGSSLPWEHQWSQLSRDNYHKIQSGLKITIW